MIRLGTDLRFVDKTANWDKVSRGVAASTRANMANTDRTHRGGLTFSNTAMVCKQRGREEGVSKCEPTKEDNRGTQREVCTNMQNE